MRLFLLLLLGLGTVLTGFAQTKTPADFGYRHVPMRYQGDTVHILVLSKKGDEQKRKPIFFFAQGSTPRPVVLYDEHGPYRLIPIQMDSLLARFHVVVVAKPGLPLVGDLRTLGPGGSVYDFKTGLLQPSTRNTTTWNTMCSATTRCCVISRGSRGYRRTTSRPWAIRKAVPSWPEWLATPNTCAALSTYPAARWDESLRRLPMSGGWPVIQPGPGHFLPAGSR